VVRPMTPRTPHVPAGTLEARAAAQAITDWYFGPNALDGTGAGLAAMEALRAALGAAPVAPDPAVSRVASMTGTHECWDGDNFIERHPELLDREDVLAALGAAPVAPGIDDLRAALRLTLDELRRRERAAGKVIASDVALNAIAILDGLRLTPEVAARLAQPDTDQPEPGS
jgi:hypothetical protein